MGNRISHLGDIHIPVQPPTPEKGEFKGKGRTPYGLSERRELRTGTEGRIDDKRLNRRLVPIPRDPTTTVNLGHHLCNGRIHAVCLDINILCCDFQVGIIFEPIANDGRKVKPGLRRVFGDVLYGICLPNRFLGLWGRMLRLAVCRKEDKIEGKHGS